MTSRQSSTEPVDAPVAAHSGPPADPRRWWVLLVVSSAMFMTTTDATIVNILIPQLQTGIGLSPAGMHWVMSIYVLMFGGLMLLGGRLTDVIGRRPVFLGGVALFTLGSVLAAVAQNQTQLLVGRAVQGIGAAGMAPGALSILIISFPDPVERNKAFGVWGTVIGVGASVGTILGGALAELGWRWAFYVNIPVGLALAVATVLLVRPGIATRPRPPADLLGALTSTVGLLLLVYGIASSTTHGWDDGRTIGALVVAAALTVVFVHTEQRASAPLVPLRLFRQRGVVAGSLGQLITAGLMLPTFFLLPQYMQRVLGYSPLETGLAYLPTTVALIVVAPLVGGLIARFGPRALYLVGSLVLTAMLVLLRGSTVDSSYWTLLLPVTALLGVGLVLCLIPTTIVGTADATESDAGTTSALLNASTEGGGVFGRAGVAAVVESRAAHLIASGTAPVEALNASFQAGFAVLLVWVALGLLLGLIGFRGLGRSTGTAQTARGQSRAEPAGSETARGPVLTCDVPAGAVPGARVPTEDTPAHLVRS